MMTSPLGRSLPRLKLAGLLLAALLVLPGILHAKVEPDQMAGPISHLVSRILERSHYSRRAMDDGVSTQTLRNFINLLDYQHLIFDKADVDTFEMLYSESLDDRIKQGDVQPAYEIFERFLIRLEERVALVKKLTAKKYDFKEKEEFRYDRRDAPWPPTAQDSLEQWRLKIKHELLHEKLSKVQPEKQAENVDKRYERLLRGYKEYESIDILQTYLTALAQTFDPHSEYMGPPSKDTFDINMRLSLTGIGAVLRSEDGYAKIVSLVPGGPAEASKKLHPNDKIEAVAQGDNPFVDVTGMKLDHVVQLIRGKKGTVVRLRTIPDDATDPSTRVTISIVRDMIKLREQEAKARIFEHPARGKGPKTKLGAIDLPSFYADMKGGADSKSTTKDVLRLLRELDKEGIEGLILDLRRNGGGSLAEAVELTGLFIRKGPVVQVRDSYGDTKSLRDTDSSIAYTGPLVVLVSRASASASEILAAAIQDYRRGVIVGEKNTFGKGTVQSMIDLDPYMPPFFRAERSGALKLTIQKFYRISGGSTQAHGVTPDIHLPSVSDHMDMTENSLKNHLPYDEIEAAAYPAVDLVTDSVLKTLSKRSEKRLAHCPEFRYVRDDIKRYKKKKEEKTASLNEKKRLAEKQESKDLIRARKKSRMERDLKPLEPKEITLRLLDGEEPTVAKSTEPAKGKDTAKAKAKEADKEDGNEDGEEGEADEEDEYAKAPPAPDHVLEESIAILGDLVELSRPAPDGVTSSIFQFSGN